MKKGILILALFLLPFFVNAEERILEFTSYINIRKDARVEVTEEIIYDFGDDQRHGIYRDVPFKYKTKLGSYKAQVDVFDVFMDDEIVPFEVSERSGNVNIKIGDPDKLITGTHKYIITYEVKDAISYFDDFDELYWNVTGDDWRVTMDSVGVLVTGSGEKFTQAACYMGMAGTSNRCSREFLNGAYLASTEELLPGTGVTISVGFPKGAVYEPTVTEEVFKTLRDNWILGLPFIVLLALLHLWYTRGKDPKGRGAIVPQYDAPEDLTPAEISVINNERVSSADVSAELVYLAVKGYIKIHQIEKKKLIFTGTDYFLEKIKSADASLSGFEQTLIEDLFVSTNLSKETIEGTEVDGVLLSSLHNTFYQEFKDIQKDVYASVTKKGYFVKSPQKVRTSYGITGFVIVFISFFFGGFFESGLAFISVALSGLLVFIFSFLMPVKTQKGVLSREYILGLKDYIHTAERDRIAFHNDPKNTPERFDALLPFAMVLGVEKDWAKLFENIYMEKPNWYTGSQGNFNAGGFVTDLKGFSSAATSNLSSAPSSSGSGGGGSSGGGFGGGGGGSW